MAHSLRAYVSQDESRESEALPEDASTLTSGNGSDSKMQSITVSCSSYQCEAAILQWTHLLGILSKSQPSSCTISKV